MILQCWVSGLLGLKGGKLNGSVLTETPHDQCAFDSLLTRGRASSAQSGMFLLLLRRLMVVIARLMRSFMGRNVSVVTGRRVYRLARRARPLLISRSTLICLMTTPGTPDRRRLVASGPLMMDIFYVVLCAG
jgi:hypothetical protein